MYMIVGGVVVVVVEVSDVEAQLPGGDHERDCFLLERKATGLASAQSLERSLLRCPISKDASS